MMQALLINQASFTHSWFCGSRLCICIVSAQQYITMWVFSFFLVLQPGPGAKTTPWTHPPAARCIDPFLSPLTLHPPLGVLFLFYFLLLYGCRNKWGIWPEIQPPPPPPLVSSWPAALSRHQSITALPAMDFSLYIPHPSLISLFYVSSIKLFKDGITLTSSFAREMDLNICI